ncbi:6178_t:CDS:2, partial [Diversispora eburnea]
MYYNSIKKHKRKKSSFTRQYFEKGLNSKGEEIQIYVHSIINDDIESRTSKKLRNTKITDFIKSHRPHPKHIQKQLEEVLLKWILITDQLISTVTNSAYKKMILHFNFSFDISGKQKIKTIISKTKHGYLGVTATWITSNFKIKDVILEIKYTLFPHTAKTIAELLYQ